jgi:hypothetical protein
VKGGDPDNAHALGGWAKDSSLFQVEVLGEVSRLVATNVLTPEEGGYVLREVLPVIPTVWEHAKKAEVYQPSFEFEPSRRVELTFARRGIERLMRHFSPNITILQ